MIEIGSAAPLDEPLTMDVKGRHAMEGVPRTVTVTDAEIRDALADTIDGIIAAVRDVLERIPPELSADIYNRGIVISGGGALLRNFDRRLSDETQLPVLVAEDPLSTVVMGCGKMLADFDLLRRLAAA